MPGINRRRFLTGSASLLAAQAFSSLHPAEAAGSEGLVEWDLEATHDWVGVGGGKAYLYAFNRQVPGPTIQARPGDHVRIRFLNSLSEPTNLHFHGLHIPPVGNADNSFLQVRPGERLTYEFDLPASHQGGTFWYHPHVHGSTARQVSRGLAGLFVVRGELDQIPEIEGAPEIGLVLQDFALGTTGVPLDPNPMERRTGREGSLITVNGQVNPQFPLERDGWLRLRIANASSSRFYRLRMEEHPFHLIAVDGGGLPAPEEREEILLTPGERVEVMLRGSRPEGSYRLWSLPYDREASGMMRGPISQALGLATFTYLGQAERTWDLPSQLVGVDPLREASIRRSFYLGQGMGTGMVMGATMNFTINGLSFNPDRTDTRASLDSVEEWESINTTTMDHPMHIHTNPFQVVGSDALPIRAWKDVALVPAYSRLRIRTAFRDFTGRTMYHCHILDHEDLGMMGIAEIVN